MNKEQEGPKEGRQEGRRSNGMEVTRVGTSCLGGAIVGCRTRTFVDVHTIASSTPGAVISVEIGTRLGGPLLVS